MTDWHKHTLTTIPHLYVYTTQPSMDIYIIFLQTFEYEELFRNIKWTSSNGTIDFQLSSSHSHRYSQHLMHVKHSFCSFICLLCKQSIRVASKNKIYRFTWFWWYSSSDVIVIIVKCILSMVFVTRTHHQWSTCSNGLSFSSVRCVTLTAKGNYFEWVHLYV